MMQAIWPEKKVLVMGIVNVTPDSFSDGGRFFSTAQAIEHALQLAAEGADWLDIGGESSRPGALPVPLAEELQRVIPVIEGIRRHTNVLISIDTYKAEVMQAAVAAGANMINDIFALRQPNALAVAKDLQVPVCLMHLQGTPQTMQQAPQYQDVVGEVRDFLLARAEVAIAFGIARENIILDPGIGFGKTLTHNLALLKALPQFAALPFPLLIGVSRKRLIKELLALEDTPETLAEQRLLGSLTLQILAAWQGARIIRTHAVAETVQTLRILQHFLT
jgi:dihydropteroate synthase